eukprot:gene9440-11181_t
MYHPASSAEEVPVYTMGVHYVTEPDEDRTIMLASKGIAADEPQTVTQAQWKVWSWAEYYADIKKVAKAMMHFGFKAHDSVNIIGFNSPEWHISNLGAIAAGGVAAGIYTTNLPDACQYISAHSKAKVVVVEGVPQLKKFLEIRDSLPELAAIVMYGAAVPDSDLQQRMDAQKPTELSTLIYTSGTTGPPKAVMLSHDNITWTCKCTIAHSPHLAKIDEHRIVSYLPLSHVAAQYLDIHLPMSFVSRGIKCYVAFARPDALKGSLKDTLQAIRPTIFFGVPRVWEKFQEAMKAVGATITGFKAKVSAWGKRLGARAYSAAQINNTNGRKPFFHFLANKLVFSKAKAALGLDKAILLFSGAAPISLTTLEYFGQLDIYIQEVYGMSENTGPHSGGQVDYFQAGTCGVLMPGVETKIEHVDGRDLDGEGEICMRGRHVMLGYMKDAEKTKAVIDSNGFLHTGDVGRIDPTTHILKITGRIKELIITAGGENIAPVPIEEAIKKLAPAVSNVMLVGDRQKYNCILVTLMLQDDGEGGFTDQIARASKTVSPDCKTVADVKKDPKWQAYLEAAVKAYNNGPTCVSNAQKVQKFMILNTDFSIPGGELTPTMKLKRDPVCKKYSKEIEAMYADS